MRLSYTPGKRYQDWCWELQDFFPYKSRHAYPLSSSRRFPVPRHLFASVPNDSLYLITIDSRGQGTLRHVITDTVFWKKGTAPVTFHLSKGRPSPKCVLQDASICQMVIFTTLTKHTKKGFAREIACGTLWIKTRWFLFCLFICCKIFKPLIPTLHGGDLLVFQGEWHREAYCELLSWLGFSGKGMSRDLHH